MPREDENSHFSLLIKGLKYIGHVSLLEKTSLPRAFLTLCLCLTVTSHLTFTAWYVYINWEDFEKKTQGVQLIFSFLGGTYQIINFVFRKSTAEELITLIQQLRKEPLFYNKDTYHTPMIGRLLNKFNRVVLIMASMAIMGMSSSIIIPIVSRFTIPPYLHTWFPLDIQKYYFLVCAFQITAQYFFSISNFFIALIYAKACANISILFSIFNHSLENLGYKPNERENSPKEVLSNVEQDISRDEIPHQLKECVEYHLQLQKCCSLMQDIFSQYLLMELLIAMTSICFGSYILTSVSIFFICSYHLL